MPPEQDHAPTRAEVEEAILHHWTTAKAVYAAGNLDGWARIYDRVDELLTEWLDAARDLEPAS